MTELLFKRQQDTILAIGNKFYVRDRVLLSAQDILFVWSEQGSLKVVNGRTYALELCFFSKLS